MMLGLLDALERHVRFRVGQRSFKPRKAHRFLYASIRNLALCLASLGDRIWHSLGWEITMKGESDAFEF
jgi:hypothetical protein